MRPLESILLVVILFSAILCISADPEPDTSDQCQACQERVMQLNDIWTNATEVSEILEYLDETCMERFPDSDKYKQKFCQDLADVFVQIPPAIFDGMNDLAWPIPEGLCATLYQCEMNCCGKDDPPEQVHLSLSSSDISLMGVSWVTLNDKISIVEWGTNAHILNNRAMGSISTYRAAGWRGTIHRATMSSLLPNTRYYYRVGDGKNRWSNTFSFKTLYEGQNITYAVIADMDFDSNTTIANLASLVDTESIQIVIHSGDISYADGYEPHWDLFFNRIQPIAAYVPYMASPGNHEFWYNFTSYKHRLYLPGEDDLSGSGSGDGMYYSWDAGHAHFISLNSETAIDTANFSDELLEWLSADLEKVDRSKTPFIVVHFHRPMYCSSSDECTTKGGNRLRKQAEEILYDFKVNLVLTGHVHSYERTYPVYNNTLSQDNYTSPTAPVYVLQGGSGNREGNDGFGEAAVWSAGHDSSVGFGIMTVRPSEISFDFYESRLIEDGGPTTKDSFTLTL